MRVLLILSLLSISFSTLASADNIDNIIAKLHPDDAAVIHAALAEEAAYAIYNNQRNKAYGLDNPNLNISQIDWKNPKNPFTAEKDAYNRKTQALENALSVVCNKEGAYWIPALTAAHFSSFDNFKELRKILPKCRREIQHRQKEHLLLAS